MSEFDSTGPSPEDQPGLTDTYFRNTRRIVQENGDCEVEYAVFMSRPVTYAGRLAIGWLRAMAAHRGVEVEVEEPHIDGAWVGLWRPIVRTVLLVLVIPAVIWDADQRGLHDKAAGTVLVRS